MTMQLLVTYVTVGYTFIVIIFEKKTYRQLQKDASPWYCKPCLKKEIPFANLGNSEFEAFTSGLSILPKKKLCEPTMFE